MREMRPVRIRGMEGNRMEPSNQNISTAAPAKTSDQLATERTDLALERTRLAHERTLMAWVRTATSMISFGFAVYKFFQETEEAHAAQHRLFGPRELAMMLAGIGTLALVLALWQERIALKKLEEMGGPKQFSVAMIVAIFIAILGVLAFIAALTRN